jgi:hypothetical protein
LLTTILITVFYFARVRNIWVQGLY